MTCELHSLSQYNDYSEFLLYAKIILALDIVVKIGDIRKCVDILSDEVPEEILGISVRSVR